MRKIEQTTTLDVATNWPYESQPVSKSTPLYEYLSVYATELGRLDDSFNELYEQQFVDTATGEELEKLGAKLGVERTVGESESAYRFRVGLGKLIAASNGTAPDIRSILEGAFGKNALDGIEVTPVAGEPVTNIEIPSAVIDDSPFTVGEFEMSLEDAFPCGHGVRVRRGDTFLFGESGDQGLGDGELI